MMKNNRTNIHAIRVMLALILCITLMPLGAFAEEVPGAADQQSGAQTTQTETPETPVQPVTPPVHTETLFVWGDVNLQFSTAPVLVDKPLGLDAEPTNLKVKKVRKGRKVTWKKASGVVDGYIILRKTGKSDFFVEVGITEPGKKSFTDKSAKKKKSYSYTVVGFRNEPEGITISPCADTGVNKGTRAYQNPRKYVQISNTISKHGHDYYTAPVLVNDKSTKKDHIEAMIKTAYKYLGDPYVVCRSGAPGKGLDCSGLVMQACYGAGVDLWPSNPARHRLPAYEYESRNIAKMKNLKTVSYKNRKRGDLIFYSAGGRVIHVAIYLGKNKIIHSAPGGVRVSSVKYKYGKVSKVKRIFN